MLHLSMATPFTYRCAHCLHPLLTLDGDITPHPVVLPCLKCGSTTAFLGSVVSKSVKQELGHQCGPRCNPSVYTRDNPRLALLLRRKDSNVPPRVSSIENKPVENLSKNVAPLG
jgi:hypothetical protein